MGLGAKIKGALHGDKSSRQYNSNANNSYTAKPPGSFPSDEVPRSYDDDYDDTFSTLTEDTPSEKPTYTNSNTKTSDYTYGPKVATTGGVDTREDPTTAKTTTTTAPGLGASDKVPSGNSFGARTGSKRLSKESKSPYWGNAGTRTGAKEPITGTGYDNTSTAYDEGHGVNRYDDLAPVDNGVSAGTYDSHRNYSRKAADVPLSNLTHTSPSTSAAYKDDKVREYDAPTRSSGRGKSSGLGVGAVSHGPIQLTTGRTKDTSPHANAYNEAGDHSNLTTTNPGMLDPYSKPAARPDSGYAPAPASQHGSAGTAGSDYGNNSAREYHGMGDDHYGPGHPGAKVMHRCHNCGADNDISRYFRKDAVYRMS